MNRRSHVFGSLFAVVAAAATVAFLTGTAQAQVAYSNLTTFSNSAYANGGATLVGTNTTTNIVADDITPTVVGPGQFITSFTFTVANFNTTNVSARPLVRFYADNNGVPGTIVAAFNFGAISFPGNNAVNAYTAGTNISTASFTNGKFWAGIAFDNNSGATGATAAQLNNLGQGIFNPPTVGSSADLFFAGNTPGTFLSSSPSGGLSYFGGSPVANFGWSFTVVPETNTFAMLTIGALPLAGIVLARRRKKA